MTRARILPEAQDDLRAAARYYEAEQSRLGRALINESRRACRLIAEQGIH